jgi:hypothetical protein
MKFKLASPRRYKIGTQVSNELDMNDATMHICRGNDPMVGPYKELVIGFKTIFMNSYTVLVEDLSGPEKDRSVLYRYAGFHSWENTNCGFTLGSETFVQLTGKGMKVLSFSGKEDRIELRSETNKLYILHSLECFHYLRLDPVNHIFFDCTSQENRKTIKVMQMF